MCRTGKYCFVNGLFQQTLDSKGLLLGVKKIPGEGAIARLFNKDANCLGYKDAQIGIAWYNEKYVTAKYSLDADGVEFCLYNIQDGKYNGDTMFYDKR